MIKKEIIEVSGILPPSRFISPVDGKHYIIPHWIEIPNNFDFKNVIWTKTTYEKEIIIGQIKASRGNTVYNITQLKDDLKCSCSGFNYRKSCKHIQQFKMSNLLDKTNA